MKKTLFISLFTLMLTCLKAQDEKFKLSFSIGNNGQLDKLLNDFYWPGHETAWLDDSHTATAVNLKYNVALYYGINEDISIRFKFGYYSRSDRYMQDFGNTSWEVKSKQKAFNLNPAINFSKSIDYFKISLGTEIPLNFVGDFVSENNYKDTTGFEANGKEEIDGGQIVGLNSYLNVQYNFSYHFSFFCEITGGLLRANLGEKFTSTTVYVQPVQPSYTSITDKNIKKLFFSPPEISFGISYSF